MNYCLFMCLCVMSYKGYNTSRNHRVLLREGFTFDFTKLCECRSSLVFYILYILLQTNRNGDKRPVLHFMFSQRKIKEITCSSGSFPTCS